MHRVSKMVAFQDRHDFVDQRVVQASTEEEMERIRRDLDGLVPEVVEEGEFAMQIRRGADRDADRIGHVDEYWQCAGGKPLQRFHSREEVPKNRRKTTAPSDCAHAARK